jgi:ABC-type amino acid transport substrate-binding protein
MAGAHAAGLAVDRAAEIDAALRLARRVSTAHRARRRGRGLAACGSSSPRPASRSSSAASATSRRLQPLGARADNAALLRRAGVTVVLVSDSYGDGRLQRAQRALRGGQRRGERHDVGRRAARGDAAPADVFGVADRIGTLQPGRDANVVVWSGDPFEFATTADLVLVRGQPVEGRTREQELGSGTLTGVTVEIMESFAAWVANTHGVHADLDFVEEPDWPTFYGRVRDGAGGVFGLGNVTITDARRDELAFSPPYMTNVAVLITHESVPELARLDDAAPRFGGLTPVAFEGTLHETRMRELRDAHLPGVPIEMATSNAAILERVATGCCFAWIDGYNFWRAQEGGAPLRRHAVGDDPGETFGIIMPRDSDWAPVLDEFFRRDGGWIRSPEYRSIMERHLGTAVTAVLLGT